MFYGVNVALCWNSDSPKGQKLHYKVVITVVSTLKLKGSMFTTA